MSDQSARTGAHNGRIPFFGARKAAKKLASEIGLLQAERDKLKEQLEHFTSMAAQLVAEVKNLRNETAAARRQLADVGALSLHELTLKKDALRQQISDQEIQLSRQREDADSEINRRRHEFEQGLAEEEAKITRKRTSAEEAWKAAEQKIEEAQKKIVQTEEEALLQEVGIYRYRHPLSDAVAYQRSLEDIQARVRAMTRKNGGAILATSEWTVNGSASEGRKMVSDFSKLMLRAFNAEADTLVRALKPYKIASALDRLQKVSETIERLGKTMHIRIAPGYHQLRAIELELTADFFQKQAEEKEVERAERERLREERRAQQEIQRERARLEKERQHFANVLATLQDKGDHDAASRIQEQLQDVEHAIKDMDYRAANIRAGYVYVISNIGSFGDRIVKIGMTRRLDPMERIHELGDASVPFKYDVHAIFFSKDAVGIEGAMHERLQPARVNLVNRRREFFNVTVSEVKARLTELTGELLEFTETAEALEYRQSLQLRRPLTETPDQQRGMEMK